MNPIFDQVNIGDRIYFNSKVMDNQDLYWIVTGKRELTQEIYLKTPPEALREDFWTITPEEIRDRLPIGTSKD